MPGSAGVSSAVLREVVGLLTVARGVPRPSCLPQAVSPLATRATAVSFVWSPAGQARHRNRAHVLKFRGRLDAERAQLVILTPTPLQGGPVGEGTPDPDLAWSQPPLSVRGVGGGGPQSLFSGKYTQAWLLFVVHVGSAPG